MSLSGPSLNPIPDPSPGTAIRITLAENGNHVTLPIPPEKRSLFRAVTRGKGAAPAHGSTLGIGVTSEAVGAKFRVPARSTLHSMRHSSIFNSWYFFLLDSRWIVMFFFITLIYLAFIVVGALLLWALPSDAFVAEEGFGLEGTPLWDRAMRLSAASIIQISTGAFAPVSAGAFALTSIIQFAGILLATALFGTFLTKLNHPEPDVVFSNKLLLTVRDGMPCLMFRIGNRRCNQLMLPEIRFTLYHPQLSDEGEAYVVFHDLCTTVPPVITATSTITHRIDDKSPLYGITSAHVAEASSLAFSCVLLARDDVFADEIAASGKWSGEDIVFGPHAFEDVITSSSGNSSAMVDFSKLSSYVVLESRAAREAASRLFLDVPDLGHSVAPPLPYQEDDIGGFLERDIEKHLALVNRREAPNARRGVPLVILGLTHLPGLGRYFPSCTHCKVVHFFLHVSGLRDKVDIMVLDHYWKPEWLQALKDAGAPGSTPLMIEHDRGVTAPESGHIIQRLLELFPQETEAVRWCEASPGFLEGLSIVQQEAKFVSPAHGGMVRLLLSAVEGVTEEDMEPFRRACQPMEDFLGATGAAYLSGARFGAADLMLSNIPFFIESLINVTDIDLSRLRLPNLMRYHGSIVSMPAHNVWLPPAPEQDRYVRVACILAGIIGTPYEAKFGTPDGLPDVEPALYADAPGKAGGLSSLSSRSLQLRRQSRSESTQSEVAERSPQQQTHRHRPPLRSRKSIFRGPPGAGSFPIAGAPGSGRAVGSVDARFCI